MIEYLKEIWTNIKRILFNNNLTKLFLLFFILIGSSIFSKDVSSVIVIFELFIITIIQLFTNVITMNEFYFLFTSSIIFIIVFIILQNNNSYNMFMLICYINWYYLSTLITNLVNN